MAKQFLQFIMEQEDDVPLPPHEQAAKARHLGTPEESIKEMGNHIDNITNAISEYRADRTAFQAVHGKDHPAAKELHDFMTHVLKTSHEEIDEPLSLSSSEIDRFRK